MAFFIIGIGSLGFASTWSTAQGRIMLSNYTFSPDRPVVGQIVVKGPDRALPKVKLVGESAKLFSVDKQNTVTLRKGFPVGQKWVDLVISTKEAGKTRLDTFRIVKDEFINNKVIAHRGAWKNTGVPENSIAALKHAIALGCAGSEFDVHMSADAVPFINHDPTIQGVAIERASAEELSKIRLSNGEPLPTLEDYLREGTTQNTTRLILEIKPSGVSKERSLALAGKVVQLVEKQKAQGWVDYISFDYDILKKVKELNPYAKVAYLNGDKTPEELARDNFYGYDYHFNVLRKNEHWLKEAHDRNLTINAWTVNDEETMDWLLENNADFITTNEPEKLLEKVNKGKAP
jgi:glycerophosphoryl diester phosphodiesterase